MTPPTTRPVIRSATRPVTRSTTRPATTAIRRLPAVPASSDCPPAARVHLVRAGAALDEAAAADEVPARYALAQVAAVRAAAAVLATRAHPSERGRAGQQSNVWQVLPRVAPELAEWAEFFDASGPGRGPRVREVTERQADDLLRDAERFCGAVARGLAVVPRGR